MLDYANHVTSRVHIAYPVLILGHSQDLKTKWTLDYQRDGYPMGKKIFACAGLGPTKISQDLHIKRTQETLA